MDDKPVLLLCGATPAYRSLSEGESGPDVEQLNANLVHLGYATRSQLDPSSDSFSSETAYALERLQAKLGEDQTGSLDLGQAVFLPGPLRISKTTANLGSIGSAGGAGGACDLHQPSGPGGAGRVPAVRRHGGRAGPDHAARQPHHAGDGHPNRDGRELVRIRVGLLGPWLRLVKPDDPDLHHPEASQGGRRARSGAGAGANHHRGGQECADRRRSPRSSGGPAAGSRSRSCARAGDASSSPCSWACSTTPPGSFRSRARFAQAIASWCRRYEWRTGSGTGWGDQGLR